MKKLFEDYSYKIVSAEEFSPFFFENRAKVFKDHFSFNLANTFTEKQIEANKSTRSRGKSSYRGRGGGGKRVGGGKASRGKRRSNSRSSRRAR